MQVEKVHHGSFDKFIILSNNVSEGKGDVYMKVMMFTLFSQYNSTVPDTPGRHCRISSIGGRQKLR